MGDWLLQSGENTVVSEIPNVGELDELEEIIPNF